MLRFQLFLAAFAVLFVCIQASNEVECEVTVNYNQLPSKNKKKLPPTIHCTFDDNAVISSPDTKFKNQRNESVNRLEAGENHEIRYLPEDISDIFPNLNSIDISKTSLQSLSRKSLHGLSKLSFLDVKGNQISVIEEDAFDDLSSIFTIYLNGNQLTSLPAKVFSKLTTLDTLYLNNNQLTSLDKDTFSNNRKLRQLHLSNNKFTSFEPETFVHLTSLVQIDLESNQIAAVNSEWFKDRADLNDINLDDNRITEIPVNFISTLAELSHFSASKNPLTTIDFAMFQNNKNMDYIAFENVKVKRILNVNVIDTLSELYTLKFEHNSESCVNGGFTKSKFSDFKQSVNTNCVTE